MEAVRGAFLSSVRCAQKHPYQTAVAASASGTIGKSRQEMTYFKWTQANRAADAGPQSRHHSRAAFWLSRLDRWVGKQCPSIDGARERVRRQSAQQRGRTVRADTWRRNPRHLSYAFVEARYCTPADSTACVLGIVAPVRVRGVSYSNSNLVLSSLENVARTITRITELSSGRDARDSSEAVEGVSG